MWLHDTAMLLHDMASIPSGFHLMAMVLLTFATKLNNGSLRILSCIFIFLSLLFLYDEDCLVLYSMIYTVKPLWSGYPQEVAFTPLNLLSCGVPFSKTT